VVVEGFQRLRPGATVNAQPWKAAAGPAPAPGAKVAERSAPSQ
jgi:hypothetical protein